MLLNGRVRLSAEFESGSTVSALLQLHLSIATHNFDLHGQYLEQIGASKNARE